MLFADPSRVVGGAVVPLADVKERREGAEREREVEGLLLSIE